MLDPYGNFWWTQEAIRARTREGYARAEPALRGEYRSREEWALALRSAMAADAARRRRRLAWRLRRGMMRLLGLLGL